MAFEEADVAHHSEVEDTSCLVAGGGGEALAFDFFEDGFGDGIFVSVEGCEASACTGIPELD